MSITLQDISKRFGQFTALDSVSLEFPTGDLVALLGPSGCGKTTLLRIIAGLEHPDQGKVLLSGEDASGRHVRERRVGFVFQHYALFRHMTVFENVAFGLRVRPRRQRPSEADIRERVHNLLNLVQLDWLADRFPSQLSGGQRQRVALARALAVEPQVLLLDEPFGALDAKVRKELRRWLRRLHEELHITSIFVTHDQDEALEVADRIVLMNQGKVEQVGTPTDIYERPATEFAYSFIGAVNRFDGIVENGRVRVGGSQIACYQNGIADGTPVVGYARPHTIRIRPANGDLSRLQARVERILMLGPVARIELTPTASANVTGRATVEVELPRSDLDAIGIALGQNVSLDVSDLRVFPVAQGQDR